MFAVMKALVKNRILAMCGCTVIYDDRVGFYCHRSRGEFIPSGIAILYQHFACAKEKNAGSVLALVESIMLHMKS